MRDRLLRLLPLLLVGALTFHFAMTVIYLMPYNPLKLRVLPTVTSYMEPLFVQKWELFAPNPTVDTRLILAACRVSDEHGRLTETEFSDMTTPLLQLKYRQRASAADRLDRAQQAGLKLVYRPEDPMVAKLREQDSTEEDRRANQEIAKARETLVSQGKRLAARAASAECDRIYGPGRTHEVLVRMVMIKPPPFSKRTQPNDAGATTYVNFAWMPYEPVSPL